MHSKILTYCVCSLHYHNFVLNFTAAFSVKCSEFMQIRDNDDDDDNDEY